MNRPFKTFDQVIISEDCPDKYRGEIAQITGYMSDTIAYIEILGGRAPKNRNGKPETRTVDVKYLTLQRR